MVNKKEFEGYICEITGKPIKDMKLCPDKQQKLKVRIKCDKGCVWCEKLKKVKEKSNEEIGIRKILREACQNHISLR